MSPDMYTMLESSNMDTWDAIRDLDEGTNWSERNTILSMSDHFLLLEFAREVVAELVQNLPISLSTPLTVDDNFTDDNFKYSAEQFDVDYFEGLSSTNSGCNSLSRKSLFVKFDPLINQLSPRGTVPLHGNNGHLTNAIPQFEGDLLLHSTPPLHAPRASCDNYMDIMPIPDTTTSHTSRLSPVLKVPTASCSLSSITQQVLTRRIPETASLIDVLKYSEHDLPEILEAVRKRKSDSESAKCEELVRALREKVVMAKKQLQQNSTRKDNLQTNKSVLKNSGNMEALQELSSYAAKNESHLAKDKELLNMHSEYTENVANLEQQLELVNKDSTTLENCFDELHQRYVRLKAVNQQLVDGNMIMQHRMAELKSWRSEDSNSTAALHAELETLQQRAEERFESLQKDHAFKMTIEKAKSLKLKMNLGNMEKAYKQKEEEKELASQICDELMKQLETIQTDPINV